MKTLFATILILVLSILKVDGQLLTYRNFNHKDGLHMASVKSMVQSNDGLLWFGTDGGDLVSFNGESFEEIQFKKRNNHHYNNLFIDGDDILFSSQYLGFYKYSTKSNKVIKFDLRSFLFGEALQIFRKNDFLYFVGTRQIISQKTTPKKILFFESTKQKLAVYQTVETSNSIVLFTNQGNFRLIEGKIQKLDEWLNIETPNNYKFGYYKDNSISLFNSIGTKSLFIEFDNDEKIINKKELDLSINLSLNDELISLDYNSIFNQASFLSKNGAIYFLKDTNWQLVPHNSTEPLRAVHQIKSDRNGNYWVLSDGFGIYKVSQETFTKVELAPIYTSPTISNIFSFSDGKLLITIRGKKTHLQKSTNTHEFTPFDFTTNAVTKIGEDYYLATNKGLAKYSPKVPNSIKIIAFQNQKLSYINSIGNELWVGVAGKGILKYDLLTKIENTPNVNGDRMPSHFYSGEISYDRKTFYFGSNNGIFRLNRKKNILNKVSLNSTTLGSYSGLSTVDKFGTIWFTLENGIVSISKQGIIKEYEDQKNFNSTLFYTFIADNLGNIIIGTNKGLNVFKVDKNANIISTEIYNDKSNFFGYETHMRSQFKKGNKILIGTVEGMFQINTVGLDINLVPSKPSVSRILSSSSTSNKDEKGFYFQINLNNPKINTISFEYSIDDSEWKRLPNGEKNIYFKNLSNGTHLLKVSASYNGEDYGDITNYSFDSEQSIWKSTWFIGVILSCLFLINLFMLRYYKTFNKDKLLNTNDLNVHLSLTPAILLFAAISAPLSHILAPIMDDQLHLNLGTTLSSSFIVFSLYLASLSAKKGHKTYLYSTLLKIGLFIVIADFLWEVYDSKLHPYNFIGVILISTMAPYILSKVRDTVFFAITLLFICIMFTLTIDDPIYPKYYFLLSISIMSFLTIFYSYLRYDSLEKLMFISSIVNKGNMPVIAFNDEGLITFSSENITDFFDLSHTEILNKNISMLNDFVPNDSVYKETDITRDLDNGGKYLVPMIDKIHEIRWIEWDYREFSNNVKVLLGQDVSKKMALQNTYELLVQHAEDFIYKCDNKGNFNFINDISYTKLGYTKGELIGTNSIKIVDEAHRNDVINFYRNHFEHKRLTSYKEFPIVAKNGTLIWVGQSITTIYSPGSNSQIDGFIALARDITAVRNQQKLILEQSDSITSSINYARRIQHNLLPESEQFNNNFQDYFIFSRPKDIVSGDFYWMETVGENTILVLGDCTGHGVPGSFMTVLGFNLLNTIVLENRIIDPGEILNALDKKLIAYLPRGEGENKVNDGMELTICVFNNNSNEMAYACAGSRFLIHEKNSFTMFKGDNKHAGDIEDDFLGYNTRFANSTADYNLFLFTDGFQDQFGGAKDKKYSFRRLLELFEENINLPMSEQERIISESFDRWIGDGEQTDDVTIVSIIRQGIK